MKLTKEDITKYATDKEKKILEGSYYDYDFDEEERASLIQRKNEERRLERQAAFGEVEKAIDSIIAEWLHDQKYDTSRTRSPNYNEAIQYFIKYNEKRDVWEIKFHDINAFIEEEIDALYDLIDRELEAKGFDADALQYEIS